METTPVKKIQTLGLKSRVFIGKYKGTETTVQEIIDNDPDYFKWMLGNVAFIKFTPEVHAYAGSEQPALIKYDMTQDKLQRSLELVTNLHNGIDPVSDANGVRQVHGLPSQINIHSGIADIELLLKYLLQEVRRGNDTLKPSDAQA